MLIILYLRVRRFYKTFCATKLIRHLIYIANLSVFSVSFGYELEKYTEETTPPVTNMYRVVICHPLPLPLLRASRNWTGKQDTRKGAWAQIGISTVNGRPRHHNHAKHRKNIEDTGSHSAQIQNANTQYRWGIDHPKQNHFTAILSIFIQSIETISLRWHREGRIDTSFPTGICRNFGSNII